jgi:hypothetical protein
VKIDIKSLSVYGNAKCEIIISAVISSNTYLILTSHFPHDLIPILHETSPLMLRLICFELSYACYVHFSLDSHSHDEIINWILIL